MQLGLSSAAVPDADLGELLAAMGRRGLVTLELREGDRHGVLPVGDPRRGRAVAERAREAGVTISGYYTRIVGHDLALARLSYALGAPLIMDGPFDGAIRVDRARQVAAAGAHVAVLVRNEMAEQDAALAVRAGLSLAWEVDGRLEGSGTTAATLLERFAGELRHIRLLGGGREAATAHGSGVGELMRQLALGRYAGSLVLAPSSPRHHAAWQDWLAARGKWGCGSSATAPISISPSRGS